MNSVQDKSYSELDYGSFVTNDELNKLRNRLQQNIGFLNLNKQRIRHYEYSQLINYHQSSLDILNNLLQIKQAENNNQYNKNIQNIINKNETIIPNSLNSQLNQGIYNRDGKVMIIDQSTIHSKPNWEKQFDINVINPPCYMIPPTGCFKP